MPAGVFFYPFSLATLASSPKGSGLRGRISHVHTSFTSLLLSVLCGLWYTMVNMGHHGNIETDRM